jgi:hypothetical protein
MSEFQEIHTASLRYARAPNLRCAGTVGGQFARFRPPPENTRCLAGIFWALNCDAPSIVLWLRARASAYWLLALQLLWPQPSLRPLGAPVHGH